MKLLPTLMAGAAAGALLMTGSAEAATCGGSPCNLLNPGSYTALGSYASTTGSGYINTNTLNFYTGNGGPTLHGVSVNGVAVFDFSSFNLGSGGYIRVGGAAPVAILSQGGVSVSGTINLAGSNGYLGRQLASIGGAGGAGGGAGGNYAADGGAAGPSTGGSHAPGGLGIGYGAGGGGGAGIGGAGLPVGGLPGTYNIGGGAPGGTPIHGQGPGGFPTGTGGGAGVAGGTQYYAVTNKLVGGSGGGAGGGYGTGSSEGNIENPLTSSTANFFSGGYAGGGGGGGGLELGGLGNLYLGQNSEILANGGNGASGYYGAGGGGAGGNIVLFGYYLQLNGYVGVNGGNGGVAGENYGGGGGGGGGTITGFSLGTKPTNYGNVFLAVYGGCSGGGNYVSTVNGCQTTDPIGAMPYGYNGNYNTLLGASFGNAAPPVPEPASMLLFGAGLTAAGVARRRRRRR